MNIDYKDIVKIIAMYDCVNITVKGHKVVALNIIVIFVNYKNILSRFVFLFCFCLTVSVPYLTPLCLSPLPENGEENS